ncbi:MAG: hypothetical protein KTR32_35260 [Granulosicoccus sp.]|nr:hypothetical protein [Granulosicoccus sp.]
MKRAVELLTTRQQVLENSLNKLERQLLSISNSDPQIWDRILIRTLAIQQYPEIIQHILKKKRLRHVISEFAVSRQIDFTIQKDAERLVALNERAQNSILTIMHRPGNIDITYVINHVGKMAEAYRHYLRVESQIVLPMILMLTDNSPELMSVNRRNCSNVYVNDLHTLGKLN